MRLFPAKRIAPLLLAAWMAAVTAVCWLAGEPCLRWALQNGAWQADSPASSAQEPQPAPLAASGAVEEFWSVPLAGTPESWQAWRSQRWQLWRQLSPDQQVQQVAALLEALEAPGVRLAPEGRKQMAHLLEQIYNHLAIQAPVRRWPLLARVQQARLTLLQPRGTTTTLVAATPPLGEDSSAAEKNPPQEPIPAAAEKRSAATLPPSSTSEGSSGPAPSVSVPGGRSQAETPARLPRAVANQARQLPSRGDSPSKPAISALQKKSLSSRPTVPSSPQPLPSRGPVGVAARAGEPLWRLWHRWYRATDAAQKQKLWASIASAGVPAEVKETLHELGSGTAGRQAKALERLAVQLGPGATAWLWWAAESPHEQVRFTALSLLASGSDPLQLRRVYRAARSDESPRVRKLARQIEQQLR